MRKRGEETQAEVLTALRRHHGPRSAYDILQDLSTTNPKIAPPTVYRALSALMARGCVHRVESLNAYLACQGGADRHASILSICNDCGTVKESVAPELVRELSRVIGVSGFSPLRHVIEVHGLCGSCGAGQALA